MIPGATFSDFSFPKNATPVYEIQRGVRDSFYFPEVRILKLKKVDTHARNKGTTVTEVIKLSD